MEHITRKVAILWGLFVKRQDFCPFQLESNENYYEKPKETGY